MRAMLSPMRPPSGALRLSILLAAVVPSACGGTAGRAPAPAPRTVTAAFTLRPAHLVVSAGTHVLVQMSHGEPNPPASSDPRVLAPDSPPGRDASGRVVFVARRAGKAEIDGQLPCAGTACAAMRGFIFVVVKG